MKEEEEDTAIETAATATMKRKGEEKRKQNRSKTEVISILLTLALVPRKKTQLMYGAELSYAQTEKFLDFLVEVGLLQLVENRNNDEETHHYWLTTDKGRKFLQDYKRIMDLFPSHLEDSEASLITNSR